MTAGVDPCRFVVVEPGTKRPLGAWDVHRPSDIGRDSLIRTGDGLLVIDIDDWSDTPQPVRDLLTLAPTLTVQSPHATGREGHYYYQVREAPFDGTERAFSWGEVKHGSLTVTPGSEVYGLRDGQDCKPGCCSPDSPGRYAIREDRPIRPLPVDVLTAAIDSTSW